MKALRTLCLALAAGAFCACAAARPAGEEDFTRVGSEPQRNYPVFLQGDKQTAAFKFSVQYPGRAYSAALAINKTGEAAFKIKILADFATLVVDADYVAGVMTYNYVLGNMLDEKALEVFEDLAFLLLAPPSEENFIRAGELPGGDAQTSYRRGVFMDRYYFKRGFSFPYKMEESRVTLRRKCEFNNYDFYRDTSLPSQIVCQAVPAVATVKLELINIK